MYVLELYSGVVFHDWPGFESQPIAFCRNNLCKHAEDSPKLPVA